MKLPAKLALGLSALCLQSTLLVPAAASAHSQGFDGNMSAVLHFEPADNPVAGEPTSIKLIDLKDSPDFVPADCDCRLTISIRSNQLASLTLSPVGNSLSTTYTFPSINTYQIHFTGQSKTSGGFAPFDITYTTRIEHALPPKSSSTALLTYGFLAVMITVITAVGLRIGLRGMT